MLKKLLQNNLFKTIVLSLFLVIFITIVFTLNANLKVSDEAIGAFNSLPILLKLIFMIMLPVFGEFKYLYQFIMIYIIPISLIYSFYLGYTINSNNQIEETLPMARDKKSFYYLLAPYIHILAILLILLLTTITVTSIMYKHFYFEVINGFINLLFWNTAIYLLASIFRNLKNKFKLIIMLGMGAYLILAFILTSLVNVSWFYYLSPLNILLQPTNNFLIYLIPLGISLSLLIIYFMKKHRAK